MILSHDEFLKLPILALQGLEGHTPADYTAFQLFLLPYLDALQSFWWACFAATLVFLFAQYVIWPLATNRKRKLDLSCPPFVTDKPPLFKFNAPTRSAWAKFGQAYRSFFSVDEIAHDVALRLFGYGILIGYLITYEHWQMEIETTIDAVTTHHVLCWPFFQSCGDWLWARFLVNGYSQTTVYMVFFGFVILAAYGLMVRKYVLAHACMLFLFVTKLYFMFATLIHNSNYEYYHTLFCMVFVFLPRKRFFGSLMVVWCYFLSTAAKIHPTWVWGSYFSSLETGLPLAPSGWEPLFTNFVIFMEMVMSWFMFSSRKWLQRSVFAFFVFFHLYSGILVGYRYPVIVMPSLLIFFGSLFRPFPSIPLNRASLPGWILIVSMLVIQMYNHTLPSDPKLTLEGDYYGLFMFEANHQCRIAFADEQGRTLYSHDYISARHRCDPWVELTAAQQKFCKYAPQSKIKFTEIHSINGGPFYEIVNEPDLCSLNYKPFADNVWIKDETTAPIVGRPLKNIYW